MEMTRRSRSPVKMDRYMQWGAASQFLIVAVRPLMRGDGAGGADVLR
jgi:hypothetical protein